MFEDLVAHYQAIYDGIDAAEAGDEEPLRKLVASGRLSDYSAADRAQEAADGGYLAAPFEAISAAVGDGITEEFYDQLEELYRPTIVEP